MNEERESQMSTVQKLRSYIYMLEKDNLRKKIPQKDTVMVDKIIHKVKDVVNQEGE